MPSLTWSFVSAVLWLAGSGVQTYLTFKDLRHDVDQAREIHESGIQTAVKPLLDDVAAVNDAIRHPGDLTGARTFTVHDVQPAVDAVNQQTERAIARSNKRVLGAFLGWVTILAASVTGVVATWPS